MSLAIVGGHQLQAGNLHELAFERRGNIVRHGFRSRAGIIYLHLDDGIVDGRKVTYRQAKVSRHSEQNHRHGQRNRHDRATNKKFGEIHDCPPEAWWGLLLSFAADELASTRTLPPGRTSI